MLTVKDRTKKLALDLYFEGLGFHCDQAKLSITNGSKVMAKGQNHQIGKTVRDCSGVKHKNFEEKNSLHCF